MYSNTGSISDLSLQWRQEVRFARPMPRQVRQLGNRLGIYINIDTYIYIYIYWFGYIFTYMYIYPLPPPLICPHPSRLRAVPTHRALAVRVTDFQALTVRAAPAPQAQTVQASRFPGPNSVGGPRIRRLVGTYINQYWPNIYKQIYKNNKNLSFFKRHVKTNKKKRLRLWSA